MLRYIPRQKTYIQGRELFAGFGFVFSPMFDSSSLIVSFKEKLCAYLDVKDITLFSSSRFAMQHVLSYYGFKKGDEVVLPVYSYAGLLPILQSLDLKPIFAQINGSLNLDHDAIEKVITKKTKAIIVPHHYGNPCDVVKIRKKVGKKIIIIEDCAQAIGAHSSGKKIGTLGDVGIFSFSRGKHGNLIGGAAIYSDDKELNEYLRKVERSISKSRIRFLSLLLLNMYMWLSSSTFLATLTTYPFQLLNSLFHKKDSTANIINNLFQHVKKQNRFNGVQAWLGLRRLLRLDKEIGQQKRHNKYYRAQFEDMNNISLPTYEKGGSFLYFPILVENRNNIALDLLKRGVDTKRNFHEMLCYPGDYDKYPSALSISKKILHLPVHANLTKKQVRHVVSSVQEVLG